MTGGIRLQKLNWSRGTQENIFQPHLAYGGHSNNFYTEFLDIQASKKGDNYNNNIFV